MIAPAGIVFVYEPGTVPVTLSAIVHEAFAARLAPATLTLVAPAAAVTVPPVQVVEAFGVVATETLPGNESVSPRAVSATALGPVLAIEIVSVDVPPA